ncbi:DUF5807 family protein [Haloplanus pelagicus]|jgi:hypothetical protein|uniref:DUF5807 family protein n=1 Tax=Haloplanus pelagicus TaxID=2949995 RepID=UPI0020406943|nr:DUF5807 family protein [Haloplanus sp. HW8-1]
MSDPELDAFLAGDRLDHVALFLTDDYLDDDGTLAEYGTAVEDGVVLVVPGEKGRQLFSAGTGMDAMAFAKEAMGTEGDIDHGLTGGACPDCGEGVAFVLAFAEARNEEVGGIYAEGDVIHAYAACPDGTAFSDRWVVADA